MKGRLPELMLNGEEMLDIKDLKRQGLNISQIAKLTGKDRKTVRKYILRREVPAYIERPKQPSKLDPFKKYVEDRMDQGMDNGEKMFRELIERGYDGRRTILLEFMRPLRKDGREAIIRYETPPGIQAQVDWGHCGKIFHEGMVKPLYCFVMTLGYSRMSYLEFTTRTDIEHFMKCHINAFEYFGGVTEEILYDNVKSVVIRRILNEPQYNPRFADFSSHYGFRSRLCKPYRPQTKGKVESGIKYVKKNFLLGERFDSLDDINMAAMVWLERIANKRVHGTTAQIPFERFKGEQLTKVKGVAPFDTSRHALRRATIDCLVSYAGVRYSVPHIAAKRTVLIKDSGIGFISIFLEGDIIATHTPGNKGKTVIDPSHYKGIASVKSMQPRIVHIHGLLNLPLVEARDLSIYEEASL